MEPLSSPEHEISRTLLELPCKTVVDTGVIIHLIICRPYRAESDGAGNVIAGERIQHDNYDWANPKNTCVLIRVKKRTLSELYWSAMKYTQDGFVPRAFYGTLINTPRDELELWPTNNPRAVTQLLDDSTVENWTRVTAASPPLCYCITHRPVAAGGSTPRMPEFKDLQPSDVAD